MSGSKELAARPLQVLIVDDHLVVRRGLKDILSKGFPHASFAEAQNVAEALELVWGNPLDATIMDITMPGRSGLEALSDIKRAQPKMPVLVLSMHDEDQYAVRALKAGAAGYVTKDKAPEELITALTKVLAGGRYVSASLAEKLAGDVATPSIPAPHERLSEREFQVLGLIAKGRTIKEIGAELSLSVKTVSTYHVRLLEKMEMTRDAELIRYAIDHRLIE